MSNQVSFQSNAETRGTVPIQFFEAEDRHVPPGTKATPRPLDRPRELPSANSTAGTLQVFESHVTLEEDTGALPPPKRAS
jgi:hypothetical protein